MFSQILKDLRTEKKLSQGQLARELGVSAGNISDWESGKTKPGYNALVSLARFFNVTSDYLLEINRKSGCDDFSADELHASLSSNSRTNFSATEIDLISMFQLLPPSHKEEIFDMVYFKYHRYVEMKKGSIYSAYANIEEDSNDEVFFLKVK